MSEFYCFKPGQTVRLIGCFHTPSQRQELWVIDPATFKEDYGQSPITVHRLNKPDCLISLRREHLQPSTLLDLMASNL